MVTEKITKDWKTEVQMTDGSFVCHETRSSVAGNTDFHVHDRYEIYLLVEGSVEYFVDAVRYVLRDGDMLLFSSREIHKALNRTKHPFQRIVLEISPEYIAALSSVDSDLALCFEREPGTRNQVFLSEKEREQYISLLRRYMEEMSDPSFSSDIFCRSLLTEALVLVNRAWMRSTEEPASESAYYSGRLVRYIDEHISEPLTLDQIAAALSLNKYYISHLFKEETGSSLHRFIILKRVEKARQLLAEGESVSEVCDRCGFNNYSNFIRTFHNVTGTSPGQYRKERL